MTTATGKPQPPSWAHIVEVLMSLDGDRRDVLAWAVEKFGGAMARAGHSSDSIADSMADLTQKYVEKSEGESIQAAARRAHELVAGRDLVDPLEVILHEDNLTVVFGLYTSDDDYIGVNAETLLLIDPEDFDEEHWRLRFLMGLLDADLRSRLGLLRR